MAQRTLVAIITTCFMCLSLSTAWAKPTLKQPDVLTLDDEQSYAEVPVEAIQSFVQIYGIVKDNYVAEKNDEDLFQQAIKGLVSGLDHYSRYLSPEDYKQLLQYTEGEFASVDFDLVFDPQLHQWVIHGLKPDADSAKLGLKNGVIVFKIDDQELKKLNHDQVRNLLSGAVGSTLNIQLTDKSVPITIVRNKKIETDVQAQLLNNQILVIKVQVFQQDTANEIKNLIEQYASSRLKGVLIDLRNNPGGLLSAAVESADLFLNQGIIVSTKSRSEGDQQFQALPGSEFQKLKVGVLINNRSASAAEVFTAALKDHGRAWVMGDKSYGKGVVQKLFALSNGSALQMTVSHYYTPKGAMIEGVGIQPNQKYILQPDMKEEAYIEYIAELLIQHK
ncbi:MULTISPECIES: S41 family peptidase [Acinetobacter]|uniref:S41 family peptidase n=1 Tax=Acinetobacter faecalis TaxID=2665161 RepID=A0A6L6GD39_9GAMM|nr:MULTISPECIES: S41 family peptidase [Acinetobacter]MDY6458502.1 S41 family peptidase [Acinetobacter faecalis]MDY6461097.1 S41 family peptidase [Acinetobacter faecalis]MDY6484116.1 S41 family peptidase [Acinetobacter faecalis]MDY6487747.1 S41 family peptidase [Acinetobacter faecalis]MDY6488286.1 S41 family peptidase [Acinetobacter faecalis]